MKRSIAIAGNMGSGKSTLLAYIGGFLDPAFEAEGRILCGGRDLTELPAQERHAGIAEILGQGGTDQLIDEGLR